MSNEPATRVYPTSTNDLIRNAGFIVMLTWHYLILFTPVLSNKYLLNDTFDIGSRQLALYFSLALSFALIAAIGHLFPKQRKEFVRSPLVIGIVGLASTAASALCISPITSDPLILNVFTVILGACEAIMMWLWLSCIFSAHHNSDDLHEFSLNLIFAGLISLFICYLQSNASGVVAVLLPVISTFVLVYETKQLGEKSVEEKPEHKKIGGRGGNSGEVNASRELDWSKTFKSAKDAAPVKQKPEKKNFGIHLTSKIIRAFFSMSLLAVFGFVFGLLQGVFIKDGLCLLMANRPLVLLGIILAGVIILLAPKQHGVVFGVNVAHHYSLMLIVLGIAILFQTHMSEVILLVAEIAILAGFNLFDSSAMMMGIESSSEQNDRIVNVASGGRPVVYGGLFVGMILGHYLASDIVSVSDITTIVCGVTIVLLVATTLIPYYSYSASSLKSATAEEANENKILRNADEIIVPPLSSPTLSLDERRPSKKLPISPWRTTCSEIAKLYQLSPRETEIFILLAKGRNVAYIQEDLVISPHTAKTHIANVYRKLEIHSSQELLDLVESFRKAEQRLSEDDQNE